jgi:hypothetical protein
MVTTTEIPAGLTRLLQTYSQRLASRQTATELAEAAQARLERLDDEQRPPRSAAPIARRSLA